MTRRHRILYLETAPSVGGSVISLYELLRRLDRSSYEPVVVVYTPHEYVDKFRALGAQVIVWDVYRNPDYRPAWIGRTRNSRVMGRLQRWGWVSSIYHAAGFALMLVRRVWPRACALRRLIREQQIELVHTNIRVGHDREGILAAWMAGIPCVCHVRHFEWLNGFDRRLAATAARLIYISEAVQKSHLESGVACTKGRVVYNGLDVVAFSEQQDVAGTRAGLGLSPSDLAAGMVGRLESWKGHDVFLRAIAQVKDELPNAKGLIIGAPVLHEPSYQEKLLALQDELGLSGCVRFVEFRSDIPAVMAALDVLVLASTAPEPFGRVLIEAMAAGKPVVATDAGAAREIIEDDVQGLLVPPGESQVLAHALTRILANPALAEAMGRAGRATVQARFTAQQYAQGVQAVYRELLAEL